MRLRRDLILALGATAALGLSACSDEQSDPPRAGGTSSATPPVACELVSREEVEAAVGVQVPPGELTFAEEAGDSACAFDLEPDGDGITVYVDPDGRESFEAESASQNAQPVAGIGAEAVLTTDSFGSTTVSALVGDVGVKATVSDSVGPRVARQLALTVAENLEAAN
jgi:hypothetical protein